MFPLSFTLLLDFWYWFRPALQIGYMLIFVGVIFLGLRLLWRKSFPGKKRSKDN